MATADDIAKGLGARQSGKGWLALFQGEKPGLNHYCYSIANYDPTDAVAKLKAAGLTSKREGDRVYFNDPDASSARSRVHECCLLVPAQ